jgi:putative toxin-antitoxin system antitoxin component (TIGR02293 family)
MLAYPAAVEFLNLPRPAKTAARPRRAAPPAELVAVDKLLPSAVATLTERLGVSEAQVVKAAGMASRTWHTRKARNAALSSREADGVLRIARIAAEAVRVFGSEAKARRWLSTPQALLGERPPFDLLDSDAGVQAVEEALGRLAWGEYA